MAKPISQSDTRWVPVKRNAAGKKIGGGYVEQISTGEKVTGKIAITTNTTSGKKAGEVYKYKGGNTVKRVSAGSASGGSNAAGGPKAGNTKPKALSPAQRPAAKKPGTRNVSPASSAGAAPSTPAAAAKPGTANKPSANAKTVTAAAKKAVAARAKKVDSAAKAGNRYPAAQAPRKAQSGYQAGKGQRAPQTPIEQFGQNVSRLWASTTARESAANKTKAAKAAKVRAGWRKYGIY